MKRDLKMQRLAAYRQGWKHGAYSAYRRTSETPILNAEYQQGYDDGVAARIAADQKATKRMGVTKEQLMKAVLR